jgi:hypothetical protein
VLAGAQPMLERVSRRARLALRGLGPARLGAVYATGPRLALRPTTKVGPERRARIADGNRRARRSRGRVGRRRTERGWGPSPQPVRRRGANPAPTGRSWNRHGRYLRLGVERSGERRTAKPCTEPIILPDHRNFVQSNASPAPRIVPGPSHCLARKAASQSEADNATNPVT